MLLVGSLLRLAADANAAAGEPVPYWQLHNVAVSEAVQPFLQEEWMCWQRAKQQAQQQQAQKNGSTTMPAVSAAVAAAAAAAAVTGRPPQSLCQLPFLMTPECKKVTMQARRFLHACMRRGHHASAPLGFACLPRHCRFTALSHAGPLRPATGSHQVRRSHHL